MNIAWHNSYFALIWLDDSRTVGTNDPSLILGSESMLHFDHIMLRDTVGNHYNELDFSLHGFDDGIGSSWRRDINHGSIATGVFLGITTIFEDWQSQMGCSRLFWVDSPNHLRAILESLLCLEGSLNKGAGT